MSKLTILLADNSMDKFYHGLVLAIGGKSLNWDVKFFVTSQAVVLFTKQGKGKAKLNLGFFARLFVKYQMKKMKIPDTSKLVEELIKEGVEFYVDEVGLKMLGMSKADLMEGVKLSGTITFLEEAKTSDVVITL